MLTKTLLCIHIYKHKKNKKTDVCQRKRWLVAKKDDHKNKLHPRSRKKDKKKESNSKPIIGKDDKLQ